MQIYQGASHTFVKAGIVNEKTSWISSSRAIWYDFLIQDWKIGNLGNLGTHTGSIVTAVDQNQKSIKCPYDYPSDVWKYYDGQSWLFTSDGDVIVECL